MAKLRKIFRIEQDSIGTMEVPVEAYYGVQSLRAKQNFPISGSGMHDGFITSLVEVKKVAAMTNKSGGELSAEVADAIITANRERCLEIVEKSSGLATVLCPAVGYMKAAEIAKEAHRSGRTVRETALSMFIFFMNVEENKNGNVY